MFKKRIIAISCLLTVLSCPVIANADDFVISNNTDLYGSLTLGYSPCSSSLGSEGIVKPHEAHVFSHKLLSLFCGSSCTAYIYPNNNCSGTALGTAKIDYKAGVVSYTNNDEEHYKVTGSGFNFTIDPVNNGLKGWLNRLFS